MKRSHKLAVGIAAALGLGLGAAAVFAHPGQMGGAVGMHGAMGGMHLSGITEKAIPRTVADLKKLKLALLAPGHCTGWRALAAMAQEFGDDVLAPSAVGKRYLI